MKFSTQIEVFNYVWKTRKRQCSVCGEPLMEPRYESFAHILGKGAYPAWKLRPKNIELMCGNCHTQYDNDKWKKDPMFARVLKKFELLKRQYNWLANNDLQIRARFLSIFKHI